MIAEAATLGPTRLVSVDQQTMTADVVGAGGSAKVPPAGSAPIAAAGAPRPPATAADVHAAADAYSTAARRVLATDAGVTTFAESNAELVGAETVIERMLVDQMTVCHNSAMRIAARASTIGKVEEMTKLMNTSLRCMTVFQEAAVTLDRVRRRGEQTITIQHVNVNGGQTVIAGNIGASTAGAEEKARG